MVKTIKTKRLPKDPGPAGWNEIYRDKTPFPALDSDIEVDWVVVGGGFAGLGAAKRLLQLLGNKERIAVVEARGLAQGPAGRNSGFMLDLPHELNSDTYAGSKEQDLRQIRLNRAAIDLAEGIAQQYGMAPALFNRSGKITASATARGRRSIETYAKHLSALNEPFELLGATELKELLGIDFYSQGLRTDKTAMIQPAGFIHSAYQGLQSEGVQVFECSPVQEMALGDSVHTLKCANGTITAKNVIMAVNGHIQSFGFFKQSLLHIFTYSSMTRALKSHELKALGGMENWGVLPADPMGSTIRKIADHGGSGHRIIVRNHATLNQSMEASESNLKDAARLQDRSFQRRFPMLKDVDMEYRWGGRLCLTYNSVPAFGEIEKRVWSACCQNGLGTVKGMLSGMMAVEKAVLGESSMLTEFLMHQQPKRLPPEPFLSVGANATLKWKEWLSGIEL